MVMGLLGSIGQLVVVAAIVLFLVAEAAQFQLAKPGCLSKCGNVTIPYPFGIGKGCFSAHGEFSLKCVDNQTILGDNIEVSNIRIDGKMTISHFISYDCYKSGMRADRFVDWLSLVNFTVSAEDNKLVALGCDTYATIRGDKNETPYWVGCMTYCTDFDDVTDGRCSGIGCCEASLPYGIRNITTRVRSYDNHTYCGSFNPCSTAFVVANDAFKFNKTKLSTTLEEYEKNLTVPVVLNWTVGNQTCSSARADRTYLCQGNARCYDPPNEVGYRCECLPGYDGNPYLSPGCQDIDECKDSSQNNCAQPKYCVNRIGLPYECKCPHGYFGNGTHSDPCKKRKKAILLPVTLGSALGIILLVVSGFGLLLQNEKKKLMDLRQRFFRKNGGLILNQELSRRDSSFHKFKLFTAEELEKATNNYGESNIIGKGGFGLVYKGILPNDQHVAIKKSLNVDSSQTDQFINEIMVLAEINNRNVVKLLGCCLEMEVPLLVYEFITNGTLYEHLHDEEKASCLTWDIRLRIATEVAGVLAYLHTIVSTPIIHRDMKSMNILLDMNYTAKVSDFGASKLVSMDHKQLATVVLGTCGYLDPEYMLTTKLTEKSDVYSFGVVLVELLTRKKALCYYRPEAERCLAMHLLLKMKEDRLLEILDEKIVSRGNIEQLKEVANLAKRCFRVKGEERPTMKEVALELKGIMRTERRSSANAVVLPFQHQEECESMPGGIMDDNEGCSSHSTTNIYQGQSTHLSLLLDDGR
ncbi:hypothetical protein Ancab_010584 [Ancistrocladus abbreviatus]